MWISIQDELINLEKVRRIFGMTCDASSLSKYRIYFIYNEGDESCHIIDFKEKVEGELSFQKIWDKLFLK